MATKCFILKSTGTFFVAPRQKKCFATNVSIVLKLRNNSNTIFLQCLFNKVPRLWGQIKSLSLVFPQQVFVICPSTVPFNHSSFKLKEQFYPHVTMEDPPDLSSLFKSVPKETVTCTSSNQEGKYHDPAISEEYCQRESTQIQGNEWRFPNWELANSWIKSELSLNLYQYVNPYISSSINLSSV